MWEEVIKLALGNGLWAVLFCVLLLYGLRDGRAREQKYRQTIDVLLERLRDLQCVRDSIERLSVICKERTEKKSKKVSGCVREEAHV
ncbi:MAG: hypothetical protein K2M95_06475 [Clostridiales bacterium]|nr:hypothetical protein [Clostridiales bacterium]